MLDSAFIYSSSDIALINSIANQCPIEGGNSVYLARNLLMTIVNDVIEFVDSCDNGVKRSHLLIPNKIASTESKPFKLYPNPNNGNMILDYSLNINDKAAISIYDITGKLINSYLLNTSNTQMTINEMELNNGIYFYHIKVNNTIVQQDKLVIVK